MHAFRHAKLILPVSLGERASTPHGLVPKAVTVELVATCKLSFASEAYRLATLY